MVYGEGILVQANAPFDTFFTTHGGKKVANSIWFFTESDWFAMRKAVPRTTWHALDWFAVADSFDEESMTPEDYDNPVVFVDEEYILTNMYIFRGTDIEASLKEVQNLIKKGDIVLVEV